MARIKRAHTLIVSAGADTASDLAGELRHLANLLDRGELTEGCSGSPSGGSMYSYKIIPGQTHNKYFRQIDEWLAAKMVARQRVCVPRGRVWCATATGKRPGKWALEVTTRCGAVVRGGTLDREARVMVPTCKRCQGERKERGR